MYEKIDIDIFAILVLIVVLVNNSKSGAMLKMRQKLFRAIIVCDILLLSIDMAILILLGRPGSFVHITLGILQCYFFAICSLLCLLWAFFCSAQRGRQNRARLFLMSVPFLALVGFLLVNFGDGLIFSITQDNLYLRGPLFHIVSVCTYTYVVYSVYVILRNKKNFHKNEFYPYLLTPILPMVAGVFQLVLEIDVLLVWPAVAIGLLVMQIYSLNEKINVDHMTGLYNRKYLDGYVEDILQIGRINYNSKSKKKFAAVMLDIDDFKAINDTYGHVEGDKAIKIAADILNNSVRKGDFVSRYGGDEFLIILNQCSMNTPRRVIGRIRENAQRYNEDHELPYKLEFSVGYKVFSNVSGLTAKQIFSSIDELMYKNKHSKAFAVAERPKEPSLNI